jgi:secernin
MKKALIIVIILVLVILASIFNIFGCDTWVALPDATARGLLVFAKNSDRTVFDCQPLMFYPRQKWPAGSHINLGRITIPQASETCATLGSSPYWCWGYEEGINEYGVIIGNEGIFTKPLVEAIAAAQAGHGPTPGPTGMDLLRLGLERSKTARQAVEVIAGLVEKYGQFGSGMPGQGLDGAYDNSFLIADSREAWVLETAGKRWIAKRFEKGVASISNTLSLTTKWDLASPDLAKYAEQKSWWLPKPGLAFDFAKAYLGDTPELQAQRQRALTRSGCSLGLLKEKIGAVDEAWMMRIARDQSTSPSLDLDVTASSCIGVLPKTTDELPVFWWAAGVPSNGCFIPVFVNGSKLPAIVSAAGTFGKKITPPDRVLSDRFSENSYWWLFRDLTDKVNLDRPARNAAVRAEFDALEKEFAARVPDIMKQAVGLRKAGKMDGAAAILDAFTAECVEKALHTVNGLRKKFAPGPAEEKAKSAPPALEELAGTYVANFGPYIDTDWKVSAKDGRLFLEMPGRNALELKDPGQDGIRRLVISDQAGVSFLRGAENGIIAMKFQQGPLTFELPRKGVVLPPEIPLDRLQRYLGSYFGEKMKETLEIVIKNNCLALKIPGQKTYELRPPDKEGKRYFRVSPVAAVSFKETDAGEIESFTYHESGGELAYKRIGISPAKKKI